MAQKTWLSVEDRPGHSPPFDSWVTLPRLPPLWPSVPPQNATRFSEDVNLHADTIFPSVKNTLQPPKMRQCRGKTKNLSRKVRVNVLSVFPPICQWCVELLRFPVVLHSRQEHICGCWFVWVLFTVCSSSQLRKKAVGIVIFCLYGGIEKEQMLTFLWFHSCWFGIVL